MALRRDVVAGRSPASMVMVSSSLHASDRTKRRATARERQPSNLGDHDWCRSSSKAYHRLYLCRIDERERTVFSFKMLNSCNQRYLKLPRAALYAHDRKLDENHLLCPVRPRAFGATCLGRRRLRRTGPVS
jgi:hypothetical protein